ncbi:MAG: glycosyltransferase family 2 protein [Planctomycetaceae bacterium]|nr:glycosyltransferase family 2 protein [Planctomycetaceae bacterium]
MQLSIVIPVFNEAESLRQLHSEIANVAAENHYDLEIIFVDDGSSDDGWRVITQIAEGDERVKAVRFRRNFGKAAALQAGFNAANGEFILTMDADLQDNPREIPDFLRLMDTGLVVVSGWKKLRHDPIHKVFPSRCFNEMVSWLTGVKLHDHNCGMKCYRREIFDNVKLYGEMHRFIPVLAAAKGFKTGEKVVEHRARQFGHSKYGFSRFVKGFLDLLTVWFLTRYSQRPLHLFGTVGLIGGAAAMLLIIISLIPILCSYRSPIVIPCAVLGTCLSALTLAAFFISFGLSAELSVYQFNRNDAYYAVKETLHLDKQRQTVNNG